jgi:hypothetical protein
MEPLGPSTQFRNIWHIIPFPTLVTSHLLAQASYFEICGIQISTDIVITLFLIQRLWPNCAITFPHNFLIISVTNLLLGNNYTLWTQQTVRDMSWLPQSDWCIRFLLTFRRILRCWSWSRPCYKVAINTKYWSWEAKHTKNVSTGKRKL